MGCDSKRSSNTPANNKFQSTHPVWDATVAIQAWYRQVPISIHASRMGCDKGRHIVQLLQDRFQSTHPVWDATVAMVFPLAGCEFQSTHPVWDATRVLVEILTPCFYFNPRIPYGMRRQHVDTGSMSSISIHASRMGCDLGTFRPYHESIPFQSTHPVWDATLTKQTHEHG